ncbi:conjugal transfer protein TraN [Vibrio sp. 10N.286.45.C10]|uniref:conjugal transfer protein TraN n=1 Tax=Vibrio TaxID=662 RepID=UPI000C85D0DD|nr:conjugal transfer protein TraN [Vibrio sp. 10N.261.46.F12]PMM78716.1 hypothetical protein BCT48_00150 [Vibrio sp. 10N.261.46.F12]
MFNRILTHFSLFAFLVQIFHVSFIGVLYASTSTVTYAQNMSLDEIYGNFQTPTYSGGNATVGGNSLGNSELFGLDVERVGSEGQFDAYQAYQNENKLRESGQGVSDRFSNNTVGSESDYDAKAYNTLKLNYNDNYQKLESDDSIMVDADNIFKELANNLDDTNSDFYSACTTETNTYSVNREYVGKVKNECMEPDRSNLMKCELKRHTTYPLKKRSGSGDVEIIDSHTFRLTVGDPTNNGTNDHGMGCYHKINFVEFELEEDVRISSVTFERVWVDDVIQFTLNEEIVYQYVPTKSYWFNNGSCRDGDCTSYPDYDENGNWAHPYVDETGFPYQHTNCEFSSSRVFTTNTNITSQFEAARASNRGIVKFKMRLGVGGGGEGKATILVRTVDPIDPKEFIEQSPVGCAAELGWIQDPSTCDVFGSEGDQIYINPDCSNPLNQSGGQQGMMCSYGGWECVESEAAHIDDYDQFLIGLPINVPRPGQTSDGKACLKANAVNYECNPLPNQQICGQPYWPESNERVCTSFTEFNANIPDRCEPYRNNADCALIEQNPAFVDPITGRAYVQESVYECNTYTNGNYSYTMEEDICTGEMQCVGGDCRYSELEMNDDFAEAMATFKMLEDIKSNMECENPDDVSTCKVFNGEVSYCGIEQTGLGFNCCTLSAGQTNIFDYIKGVYHHYAMEQSLAGLASSGAGFGSWASSYPTPVTNTVTYVTDAVSAGWDFAVRNITGEVGEAAAEAATESLLDEIKGELMKKVADLLPDAIRDAIFDTVTEGTGSTATTTVSLNPAVSGAFATIMAVYAAYQLIKLGAMMISECDDLEMGMGMKLDQQQCIYASTSCHKDTPFGCLIKRKHYCCYPSPLGRIIMEQAAPQLNISLDPRNGQCSGMTLEQVSELDWDTIDLTEWENLIMASGLAVEHDDLNIDTLSNQAWMPNNDDAMNPVDLNQARFESTDADANLKETHDAATPGNLDCSVYPRPPVCDSPLSILDD